MSKPGKVLKSLCKKLGVRLTVKRGKKRVYKSIKILKAQCKRKKKKKVKRKKVKRKKKKVKRKKKKVKRKRRRKFGSAMAVGVPAVARAQSYAGGINTVDMNNALTIPRPATIRALPLAKGALETTPQINGTTDPNVFEIRDPNLNIYIWITLVDTNKNGIPFKKFLNCTNNGCYFHFAIISTSNQYMTKMHLSFHRTQQDPLNPLSHMRHRVHLSYGHGNTDAYKSFEHVFNGTTQLFGPIINNPYYELQVGTDNNNNLIIRKHPSQPDVPKINNIENHTLFRPLFNAAFNCLQTSDRLYRSFN